MHGKALGEPCRCTRVESRKEAEPLARVDGRYALLVCIATLEYGEVWTGTDGVLDRAVDVLVAPEDIEPDVRARIDALLDTCDGSYAAEIIPEFLGHFVDDNQLLWVFAAHQGPGIRAALASRPEACVRSIGRVIEASVQPDCAKLVSLDVDSLRMVDDQIRVVHPLLHGAAFDERPESVWMSDLASLLDELDVIDPQTRSGRRIARSFPMLQRVVEQFHQESFACYDDAAGAVIDAISESHEIVHVVGGGPIVIATGSNPVRDRDEDAGESTQRTLELVPEFEELAIDEPVRRFRRPSRVVIGIVLIVAALAGALVIMLRYATGIEHTAQGNMPGRDMRRVVGSVSQEQGKVSDLLESYRSRPADLAAVRAAGMQLADSARSAQKRIADIKPGSGPEAELKQTSRALLRAQYTLGRDLQQLPKVPARVTSIDGQVVLFGAQEVAKQFVQVSIDMRTMRYVPANPENYSRLPVASKAFLDEVLDQEWKRQEDELAARMQRQQQSLKQRISKAEQDFRKQMMDAAYRSWRTQFDLIKSKAEVEMSRGRSIAQSGTCNSNEIQRSLGTRGMLMFQLNTLAPPNQSALSEQVSLQKRLTTSTASDFAVLSSKMFSEEAVACV